jgi:hypothetical protein
VLVNAHRADAPRHAEYYAWLTDVVNGDAAFGLGVSLPEMHRRESVSASPEATNPDISSRISSRSSTNRTQRRSLMK